LSRKTAMMYSNPPTPRLIVAYRALRVFVASEALFVKLMEAGVEAGWGGGRTSRAYYRAVQYRKEAGGTMWQTLDMSAP